MCMQHTQGANATRASPLQSSRPRKSGSCRACIQLKGPPGGNLGRRLRLSRNHLKICSPLPSPLCMLWLPEGWPADRMCRSSPAGAACRCTADPGQLAGGHLHSLRHGEISQFNDARCKSSDAVEFTLLADSSVLLSPHEVVSNASGGVLPPGTGHLLALPHITSRHAEPASALQPDRWTVRSCCQCRRILIVLFSCQTVATLTVVTEAQLSRTCCKRCAFLLLKQSSCQSCHLASD